MADLSSEVLQAIQKAFEQFFDEDSSLFGLPLESDCSEVRKLHEVCINHKLAEKFSIQPCFSKSKHGALHVDIEFNRKGAGPKELNGILVRPDIIVHNRKSADEKFNLLVVECKKGSAARGEIEEDRKKVASFITSEEYAYQYGLCVIYKDDSVYGELYERKVSMAGEPEAILLQKIDCRRSKS
ncbi:MAG: hypothetical protein NTY98_22350 [Verrucomicrobia bacterium]|nr:hypothetical protein [Verrucomicrobiota bacterium]